MSLIDSLVRAVAVGVIIVILSATAGCSRTSGAPDNGGLVVDQDELSQIESSRNNLLYEPILAGSASDETAIDTYYIRDAMMKICLLYTSPSPRDQRGSRMPSSA